MEFMIHAQAGLLHCGHAVFEVHDFYSGWFSGHGMTLTDIARNLSICKDFSVAAEGTYTPPADAAGIPGLRTMKLYRDSDPPNHPSFQFNPPLSSFRSFHL